ncbi:MAG: 5-methyltetrahydropteroyltriglutamate--homocysteine S-methyltransferase [Alphaproteobacteria bacterium]|nr:5-methyltetrahydropteroyltriglutamate--homocysteine S-methyltransferase [Alphaproteobacteria bacterium]
MAKTAQPPFRADQVGSLLRPPELHAAREQAAKGAITKAQLRVIEDRAIKDVVALQESAGLRGITDGEFRRAFWHVDFLTGFTGIAATQVQYALGFRGEHGETAETHSMLVVRDKVRRIRPIMVDDFKFLKGAATRTPKVCIPAPTYLHMRGGRKVVSATAYPDLEEFWSDIVAAYRAEIKDLAVAGLTYLQIDDVSFATLCDEGIRTQVRRDGEDPDKMPARYAQIISALITERPPGLRVTMHTCRGNFQSMWMAEGGYDAVAEGLFGAAVDGFFLEYDDSRSGGFEPLRFVPKGKYVVLGLVSTKRPELESKDVLKRRIDEAAKYVPLENLCLSPQCGFASSHHGNKLAIDLERRKLALVVEVATEVWGGV